MLNFFCRGISLALYINLPSLARVAIYGVPSSPQTGVPGVYKRTGFYWLVIVIDYDPELKVFEITNMILRPSLFTLFARALPLAAHIILPSLAGVAVCSPILATHRIIQGKADLP